MPKVAEPRTRAALISLLASVKAARIDYNEARGVAEDPKAPAASRKFAKQAADLGFAQMKTLETKVRNWLSDVLVENLHNPDAQKAIAAVITLLPEVAVLPADNTPTA